MEENYCVFFVGMLGNILFGMKSIPQILSCYRKRSTNGLSIWMLIADFFGNIACAYYIYYNTGFKIFWQYINYGFATLWLIILFVMIFIFRKK
jgi:uncharacterized protein with PQ loop repeat